MTSRKHVRAFLMILAMIPAFAYADEQKATVVKVNKDKKEIVVKTKEGEKTFKYGSKTKGIENAKDGAKVTIEYDKKNGEMNATSVMAR
jgi:hypothetical protein